MTRDEFLEKYKPTCKGCKYNTSEKYDVDVYITHCSKMKELGVKNNSHIDLCVPDTGCCFFELEKK